MLVNADFSRKVFVAPTEYEWVPSPQRGVERVMLDRVGGEKARATTIVRYAAESYFPGHFHPGGEEILVLSGSFSEGEAHYPAGWYLRNPPGSSHEPYSREGAVLFVKLWQMPPDETRHVRVDTQNLSAWRRQGTRNVCPLFSNTVEQVGLHSLGPGEVVFGDPIRSAEVLVLAGALTVEDKLYEEGSWMRLPHGHYPEIAAGSQGATVYVKTAHPSCNVNV